MDWNVTKSILGLSDEGRAYVSTLDEAGGKAFFAKSVADQAADIQGHADAEKAKKDKAEKDKMDAEKAKNAGAPDIAEMIKSAVTAAVAPLQAALAEVQKSASETEFEKMALESAYAGFPGGSKALVPLLKNASELRKSDETSGNTMFEVLKAQAAAARRSGRSLGIATDIVANDVPTIAKADTAAAELAKSKGMSLVDAEREVIGSLSSDDLIKAVEEEETVRFGQIGR